MATDPEALMEKAARVLCQLRGQDPDEVVEIRRPGRPAADRRTRWEGAREELVRHHQRDVAFETVARSLDS